MSPARSRRKRPGSSLRRARSPVAPKRTMTWSAGIMPANVRAAARARIGDVPSLAPAVPRSGRHPGRLLEREADELHPRRDPELGEDLAQVILDGLGAHEELRRNGLVGRALADEPRHLELLRRQLGQRAEVALAGLLAGGAQLAQRALGPGGRPEPLEAVAGGAQVYARV